MKNEEARVHFIPSLKDGVFVTLCAPLVIKSKKEQDIKNEQAEKKEQKKRQENLFLTA
ncbi:hypothetical protein [Methanosarcina mazei]|uniref:hypothetical protein n=1 Tax=Methanosarcina mazei TaxID=2209 RepID=UPI0012D46107|nr:hypothetical protein [Methanosarcina mazei]